MPNRRFIVTWIIFITAILFSREAFADTVEGTVSYVNSRQLDLTVYDAQGRPYPNILRLKVDGQTKTSGVSSVTMLKKRDVVRADVKQESGGIWRANSVSRLQLASNAIPATSKPSFDLMQALKSPTGQKVIRSGLTGAVVGATASGASGGKAGKGALIGAGVSILGGFLQDILNGPSQGQTQTSSGYSAGPSVDRREDTLR